MPTMNDTLVLERVNVQEEKGRPKMFDAILHNDDVTPFNIVVDVLREAYSKTEADAEALMLMVHFGTKGLIGTYPEEEAYERLELAYDTLRQLNCNTLQITNEEHID